MRSIQGVAEWHVLLIIASSAEHLRATRKGHGLHNNSQGSTNTFSMNTIPIIIVNRIHQKKDIQVKEGYKKFRRQGIDVELISKDRNEFLF